MKKYSCKVIQDLMPLYLEQDLSEESKKIVEEHLKDCEACKKLMEAYVEDAPATNNFSEDLPKINTFRRLKKRVKLWMLAGIVIILVAIISVTAISYKLGENSKNNFLTVDAIVNTYRKQGVVLKEKNSKAYQDLILEGIKPYTFTIGNTNDRLLIYIFKSFAQRKEATVIEGVNYPGNYDKFPINAYNAYILYMPDQTPKSEAEIKNFNNIRDSIFNIAFKYLNQGKETIYKGESASWEGSVTRKYYLHWNTDDKGMLVCDSYDSESPVIKYKLSTNKDLGPISIEYTYPESLGVLTANGLKLNKERNTLDFSGGGEGSNAPISLNDPYKVTITVNEKEEKLELKAN